ncbi:hypothetical protein COCC4DRAFT_186073 [Bipolaris maydis ATCC 48331]|uniref:Uncharacterized protein n=2 Tax=Cochliobolus heterostrophus TaxID=5016 RepID=M2SW74_COCH5|nr:uncharacterized protein COCC4DRAFT_186073 [Bipolaris maydis ATCC 48331]EMD89600.1 hypothetical protein COCHEDRAFT_1105733 [Bipolaris maydis C5]ENI10187.1 hypothetical protein COCC4DRAFT_186073 [Bipolaris maydis ATCC 48331]
MITIQLLSTLCAPVSFVSGLLAYHALLRLHAIFALAARLFCHVDPEARTLLLIDQICT